MNHCREMCKRFSCCMKQRFVFFQKFLPHWQETYILKTVIEQHDARLKSGTSNKSSSPPRNLKGGIGSLFDPCVNAFESGPFWWLCMEVNNYTFRFGAICAYYHSCMFNLNGCMILVHARKATHAWQNCLESLARKESGGAINRLDWTAK